MTNIQTAFHQLRLDLSTYYPETEASAIAELLIENVTGLNRMQRIMQKGLTFSEHQEELWNRYVAELLKNRPIQYVLGKTTFCGLEIMVDESVLIPRPETEELVQLCLKYASSASTPYILDIGTGSGCIPLALKKRLPHAKIFGVDISEKALSTANKNAGHHNLAVFFFRWDILNEEIPEDLPKMNFITSNPPYITLDEKESLAPNVLKFEPEEALFVTNHDPLQFYKRIEEIAQKLLQPDGSLFFELNESYAFEVQEFFIQKGWKGELKKDFFGKERMGVWCKA